MKTSSVDDLCAALHEAGYASARRELEVRGALRSTEWDLISAHKVAIGMSETALLCSLGKTTVNRTVTAYVTRKQYVYGDTFVYVENGRVTGFQDRQ